jgi:hypothetical protein
VVEEIDGDFDLSLYKLCCRAGGEGDGDRVLVPEEEDTLSKLEDRRELPPPSRCED